MLVGEEKDFEAVAATMLWNLLLLRYCRTHICVSKLFIR